MKGSVVAAALSLTFVLPAAARPLVIFEFGLDGSQEVPPNALPGTGFAHVELDTDTNFLSWNVTFQDLSTPVTAAHFHGPALPGVNGPVILGIAGAGQLSPIIGDAVITDEFEQILLDGLSYINIHTQQLPAGEIRGQVVPSPASLGVLGIVGLVGMRRRR